MGKLEFLKPNMITSHDYLPSCQLFPHCLHNSNHAALLPVPWTTSQDLASGLLYKVSVPQTSASQHPYFLQVLEPIISKRPAFTIPFISASNSSPKPHPLGPILPHSAFSFPFYNNNFLTYYTISLVIMSLFIVHLLLLESKPLEGGNSFWSPVYSKIVPAKQ